MPKFFVKEDQIKDNEIIILGQDVNHIKKVLRAKKGDELQICNSQNGENFLCEINDLENENIICKIKEKINKNVESNIEVTIFQGLPKSDKMEYIIQKSVELGVHDITPVGQKISEVASKQCGRDIIPKINNIINISNICSLIENYNILIVAYENEKENTLKQQLKEIKQQINDDNKVKIGIVIGPEGGLEDKDVELLKQNGAKVITLGKRILRTETVALNVLSIIMYELEN